METWPSCLYIDLPHKPGSTQLYSMSFYAVNNTVSLKLKLELKQVPAWQCSCSQSEVYEISKVRVEDLDLCTEPCPEPTEHLWEELEHRLYHRPPHSTPVYNLTNALVESLPRRQDIIITSTKESIGNGMFKSTWPYSVCNTVVCELVFTVH